MIEPTTRALVPVTDPVAAYLAGLSPNKQERARSDLRRLTRVGVTWAQITPETAAAIRTRLMANYAPRTAEHTLRALRGILRVTIGLGLFPPDVHAAIFRGLSHPRTRPPDRSSRVDLAFARGNKLATAGITENVAAAFWTHVHRGERKSCWPWTGPYNQEGKGLFHCTIDGKGYIFLAHRVAYELTNGTVAGGWSIKQTCPTVGCVNPLHLVAERPRESIWAPITAANGAFAKDVAVYLDESALDGLAAKTIRTYAGVLLRLILWLEVSAPEVRSVADLTRVQIRAWQLAAFQDAARPIARRTMIKYTNCVRAFLRYYGQNSDLPVLAAERVKIPKGGDYLPRAVARGEHVAPLLNACDRATPKGRRDAAILALLFGSGLRVGELVALNRADLPLARPGQDDALPVSIIGKGQHARLVFLNGETQMLLRATLRDREERDDRDDRDPAVFVRHRPGWTPPGDTNRRLTARGVQVMLKRRLRALGLPEDLTPHSLRHGFAIEMLESGVDIRYVQDLMGHKQITTTQVYTRLSNPALRAAYLKRPPMLVGAGEEAPASA